MFTIFLLYKVSIHPIAYITIIVIIIHYTRRCKAWMIVVASLSHFSRFNAWGHLNSNFSETWTFSVQTLFVPRLKAVFKEILVQDWRGGPVLLEKIKIVKWYPSFYFIIYHLSSLCASGILQNIVYNNVVGIKCLLEIQKSYETWKFLIQNEFIPYSIIIETVYDSKEVT